MIPNLIHDGKLDRIATAEALRKFLDDSVRAAGLELKVSVRAVPPETSGLEGHAEVIADLITHAFAIISLLTPIDGIRLDELPIRPDRLIAALKGRAAA